VSRLFHFNIHHFDSPNSVSKLKGKKKKGKNLGYQPNPKKEYSKQLKKKTKTK